MYKLEIKLKQHTPLIHFQHDQEGATLRASEIKPKLDKYIIDLIGWGKVKENEWQIKTAGKNDEKKSLNYKLSIESPKEKELWPFDIVKKDREGNPIRDERGRVKKERFPLYFGNVSRDVTSHKKLIFFPKGLITFTLCSINDELLDKIRENICSFFACTTFGTRQSKGFGCFYPVSWKMNNQHEESAFPKLDSNQFNNNYYFVFKPNGFDRWHKYQNLFTTIDFFYKTMRSGINQSPFYFKSLIFHYALDEINKQYYDKRKIRQFYQHFKPNKTKDRGEESENKNCRSWNQEIDSKSRLYRDMLGLSCSQTWQYYNAMVIKESAGVNDRKIERFKSPITFVPLEMEDNSFLVIIQPSNIPDAYKGQSFSIKSVRAKSGMIFNGINEGEKIEMKTPEKFDIIDYLSYVFNGKGKSIAINQLKLNSNKEHFISKILLPIYESLHSPSLVI